MVELNQNIPTLGNQINKSNKQGFLHLKTSFLAMVRSYVWSISCHLDCYETDNMR